MIWNLTSAYFCCSKILLNFLSLLTFSGFNHLLYPVAILNNQIDTNYSATLKSSSTGHLASSGTALHQLTLLFWAHKCPNCPVLHLTNTQAVTSRNWRIPSRLCLPQTAPFLPVTKIGYSTPHNSLPAVNVNCTPTASIQQGPSRQIDCAAVQCPLRMLKTLAAPWGHIVHLSLSSLLTVYTVLCFCLWRGFTRFVASFLYCKTPRLCPILCRRWDAVGFLNVMAPATNYVMEICPHRVQIIFLTCLGVACAFGGVHVWRLHAIGPGCQFMWCVSACISGLAQTVEWACPSAPTRHNHESELAFRVAAAPLSEVLSSAAVLIMVLGLVMFCISL